MKSCRRNNDQVRSLHFVIPAIPFDELSDTVFNRCSWLEADVVHQDVEMIQKAKRSHIPFIICLIAVDLHMNLGCYGDKNAVTFNLDRPAS